MKNEFYRAIIERYVEAYNRLDVDGMLLNASPEIVFENISGGAVNMRTGGIEQLRKQAEESKQYFTERKQVIAGMEFGNDMVEVSVDFGGRLAMDLPGGMKAGDKIELKGKTIFKFKDEKIVGITDIS